MRDAHRILNHLCANHVFTFASADGFSYRYHNLFREFLRRKSAQEDGPQEFREQQRRAAEVLQAANEFEMATELLFSANMPAAALDVLARAGEIGMDACRSESLRSWLARLPRFLALSNPRARLLEGQVLLREGDYDDALACLRAAQEMFDASGDERGTYQALSASECTLFWKGDIAAAEGQCRAALAHASTAEERTHSLVSLGAALAQRCRWREAERVWEQAEAITQPTFIHESARIACHRVGDKVLQGRFREATRMGQRILPTARTEAPVSLGAPFLNMLGLLATLLGEYDRGTAYLDECAAVRNRYGYDHMGPTHHDTRAVLLFAVGEFDQARELIESGLHSPALSADIFATCSYLCHLGTGWRRHGDLKMSLTYYNKAVEAATLDVDPFAGYMSLVNREFTIGLSDPDHGLSTLATLGQAAQGHQLHFIFHKSRFFRAVLLHARGHVDEALAELASVVPTQLGLGHIDFLSQELNAFPQLAVDLLRVETRSDTRAGVIDAIARHWSSTSLLGRLLGSGSDAALDALEAASRLRTDEQVASLARRAQRHRSPAVRRAAAQLQMRRLGKDINELMPFPELTRRESEVLTLIAQGLKNQEIAERLVLSPVTVKTHVNRVFAKLGITDRVQAVLYYNQKMASPPGARTSGHSHTTGMDPDRI